MITPSILIDKKWHDLCFQILFNSPIRYSFVKLSAKSFIISNNKISSIAYNLISDNKNALLFAEKAKMLGYPVQEEFIKRIKSWFYYSYFLFLKQICKLKKKIDGPFNEKKG